MNRHRTVAMLLLVLALVAGACAEPEDDTPAAGDEVAAEGETSDVDAEAVSVGEALAQIRGHHRAAIELYGAEDVDGALAHAHHPIEELLDVVSGELEEHGGDPEALSASLDAVVAAIESGGDVSEIVAPVEEARTLTEEQFDTFAGEVDVALEGSVVSALLATVAHEYAEAVGEDGIELVLEYQDGYAFSLEAKDLYARVRADVEKASAEEAEEIEEAWGVLEQAFASVTPPEDPMAVEDVEAATALIGHELEETIGALATEEADHDEVVAEIEELLAEIEETYAAGEADVAAELSAEAYLENYEVIEADIIELAPEINEELEPLLGAELRRQIQAGASEDEIAAMIERAEELLQEALAALEAAH